MKKRPSIVSVTSLRPFAMAFVLSTLAGSAASAANTGPAPRSEPRTGLCLQVKNPAARDACWTAGAQLDQGNYVVALNFVRKAIVASPKEGVLRVMIGVIHLRREAWAQAEQEFRQARTQGVRDEDVLPRLFVAMIARHEEIKLLNEFPEPAPGAKGNVAAATLHGRTMALESLGRLAEAAAAMDRSLSLKRDAEGLIIRSNIALKMSDTALAGKLVDEAFRLDPQNPAIMGAKLKQLERSNDTAGVLALSDQLLGRYPMSSVGQESKIKAFLKLKQDAKAQAQVNAILARRPKSALGVYYNAVLMSRANKKLAAAQAIQSIPLEFVKARPDLALSMAQIAFDNGNVETGAATLSAALSVAPDLVDVRLQLANLRLRQNSPQSALIVLSPAQDSRDPRIGKLLSEIRARIAKDRAF